jgi:hypothetical protein
MQRGLVEAMIAHPKESPRSCFDILTRPVVILRTTET